ncbi:4-(cytidine 5'-diphospho)-2-C-methyl-D-erythritol kinase [Streptomyces sp. MZ04]|uniref:4-(cytidine 5'-diphospho)-2-C-methyl-D-erythritol kinase n=1 Tax=Streptomyces sp. MZ04 TaxID=2559236 RepID=UPI00107E69FB|nr:4-(cytidine 5'-diphospho)-2-C-methyl-D-erythritol kinase [Streptomyces sp. MZ04]TGB13369.1 4-(cytidine 5'-diphospho)-2-C-methyl-D-erythritol kinase [Streptomyces sp. MZ04]
MGSGRSSITVRVPAKVNVQLAVGAARPDGFHDLANVFLAKDIPVAGGMAGGSADGAGALLACDALWNTGASRAELLAICAELGSDVPFSLVGGAALGTGRGERLTPLRVGGGFHWVFAMAERGLSTPAVFREFDRLADGRSIPEPVASADLLEALATGDADALAAAVSNDPQPAALSLFPELARTLEAGRTAGALTALVSGSGPTAAFLARDAQAAQQVAQELRSSGTCRSVRTAAGPVPGATTLTEAHDTDVPVGA